MGDEFAVRLNHLFATIHPAGKRSHTNAELARASNARSHPISAQYIAQLRSGKRINPSAATIAAIAEFFLVDSLYFTDDTYYRALNEELARLAEIADDGALRIASCNAGLSEQSRQELIATGDCRRGRENLTA